MLTINDDNFTHADFIQQQASYRSLPIINQHNTIAVCVEDSFTWLTLCYYFQSQKISVMPIHPSIPIYTAERMAKKANCSLLIYRDLTQCLVLSSGIELSPNIAFNSNVQPDHQASNAGIIQMSSGTTGEPKCILRSWAEIDIEIDSYCKVFSDAETMTPVIVCPITHSYGLICGVMVALKRGKIPIIITSINPKYLMKKLKSCERPLLYSSPVMLQGLLRLWPADSKLFAAMTSGSTMSAQVFEQIAPRVQKLYQQYGCSEAGCISISQNLKVANDLGIPLPHVTVECSNNEQEPSEIVAKMKTANGIKTIKTQDLGYFSSAKNLHFLARLDDTIIVSGLNVYPTEVEDIILQHPQVSDAVIFKIEDKFSGYRVCLQYVTKTPLPPVELRQWCNQKLAPFQVPQVLEAVSEIARMANSKVNRNQIAQTYQTDLNSKITQNTDPNTNQKTQKNIEQPA